jgi:hypothetical protein
VTKEVEQKYSEEWTREFTNEKTVWTHSNHTGNLTINYVYHDQNYTLHANTSSDKIDLPEGIDVSHYPEDVKAADNSTSGDNSTDTTPAAANDTKPADDKDKDKGKGKDKDKKDDKKDKKDDKKKDEAPTTPAKDDSSSSSKTTSSSDTTTSTSTSTETTTSTTTSSTTTSTEESF